MPAVRLDSLSLEVLSYSQIVYRRLFVPFCGCLGAVGVGLHPDTCKLRSSLHHIAIENELLHIENNGLREALQVKKLHNKKSKPLDLQQRQEYHGGATF